MGEDEQGRDELRFNQEPVIANATKLARATFALSEAIQFFCGALDCFVGLASSQRRQFNLISPTASSIRRDGRVRRRTSVDAM